MPRPRRYPSDLTDAQWAVIEPLLPEVKTGGRPEKHSRRDIVDAILYVVRAGCSWRQLPFDFPPWQTVYWYFVRWEEAKVTEQVMVALRRRVRAAQGRREEPSAGIIDSQSVKGADTVGRASRGYDANNYAEAAVMPGRGEELLLATRSKRVEVGITAPTERGLLAASLTCMSPRTDVGWRPNPLRRRRQATWAGRRAVGLHPTSLGPSKLRA